MVLSSGGVILLWLLMMTLWIPRIDYAKSFKSLGEAVTRAVNNHPSHGDSECVADYNLGFAQRSTLQYHAAVSFVHRGFRVEVPKCNYLLLQDTTRQGLPVKVDFESKSSDRWELIWTGNRNSDRHEFFFLYARSGR